jgi:hypothetical protein
MVTVKKVGIAEAGTLLDLSKKTFYEAYAHLIEPASFEKYVAGAFTLKKMLEQITHTGSQFYFAIQKHHPIGYLKINVEHAQTEFKDDNALEIERIYVLAANQGKHIGTQLLNFALDTAKTRQVDYAWLGVWEQNQKAIDFYSRKGFVKTGSHDFLMGDERQTDILMRKIL